MPTTAPYGRAAPKTDTDRTGTHRGGTDRAAAGHDPGGTHRGDAVRDRDGTHRAGTHQGDTGRDRGGTNRGATDLGATDLGDAGHDRGAVTVEAALAMSVLAVVLAAALAGVATLIGHLRCVDAAREAARLAARDDDTGAVAVVRVAAPDGAELRLDRRGELVTATVTSRAAGGLLPGVQLSASAVAALEPTPGSP